MKLVGNRYFVWAVGLAMLAISPQAKYFWYDITGIYLDGSFDFRSAELYAYSFAVWYTWIFRLLSAWLNVTIVKKRRNESHAILWGLFAIILPAFSLIIQGFLMGPDKKRNMRHIRLLIGGIVGGMLVLFIAGIVAAKIEQHRLREFTEEYVQPGLRPSVVAAIDRVVSGVDTTGKITYLQLKNIDTLTQQKDTLYVPSWAELSVSVAYDKMRRIRMVSEQTLNQMPNSRTCYFDTTGHVIFKESVYVQREFYSDNGAAEIVDEYFVNSALVKRAYRIETRKNSTDFTKDSYLRPRYEFVDFKTVGEFKKLYPIPNQE